jgi:hypothetical protein
MPDHRETTAELRERVGKSQILALVDVHGRQAAVGTIRNTESSPRGPDALRRMSAPGHEPNVKDTALRRDGGVGQMSARDLGDFSHSTQSEDRLR